MQRRPRGLEAAVRQALPADAPRIAALAQQLGYDVPLPWIDQVLRNDEECTTFVAVVPRAGVVGWIAVSRRWTLLRRDFAEVEGLVVEDEFRGNRIGERLVSAAQAWARRQGCTSMIVRSNVVRTRARAFYLRLHFELLKAQNVFVSPL